MLCTHRENLKALNTLRHPHLDCAYFIVTTLAPIRNDSGTNQAQVPRFGLEACIRVLGKT